MRVPDEVAHRRRQKAREKARKHGRELLAEYSKLLGWSLFVTNLPPERLTWQEAVVLYRAQWHIELLFKLCRVLFRGAHNQLARHRPGARAVETMAMLWAKLIGVMLQHCCCCLRPGQTIAAACSKRLALFAIGESKGVRGRKGVRNEWHCRIALLPAN